MTFLPQGTETQRIKKYHLFIHMHQIKESLDSKNNSKL
jgi:hypothetical protein